jgi:putative transposase
MLNRTEFELWCAQFGLADEAAALVNQIRSSEPVRAVRSGNGNVPGRYPSRKMGKTIQFESHKNELAFINLYESDCNVLEYYDQPSTIKLTYNAASGRHLGVLHTPDFFAIRSSSAGWEECKIEEHLVQLAIKSPNRYVKDLDGEWRCPPGEAYAKEFGFYYRIRSSKEINWTYQRNLEFFEDYYRSDSLAVEADVRSLVSVKIAQTPKITLEQLFECTKPTVRSDDIFKLILTGEIYVDLRSAPIVEPNKVYVYPNQEASVAYENLLQTSASAWPGVPRFVDIKAGGSLQWDGKCWTIINVGETIISLVSEEKTLTELPLAAFEKLVQDNRIIGLDTDKVPSIHAEVEARIVQADKRALAEANRRYEIIRPYLAGEPLPEKVNTPERTLRRWLSSYRVARQVYGNGYVALLPRNRSGNTTAKLPPAVRSIMREFIESNYETEKQKGKFAVYASYGKVCKERGVEAASYKTFAEAIKRRPRYVQTSKRQGLKAAYKDKEFYWELTPTTPRHGDWPLHIAHIDHTELDAELVCSLTGKSLGRAWATFLTDAYSRRFAAYLTYDPPSYRSCMMIMRECVRRFGRLPQIVVSITAKNSQALTLRHCWPATNVQRKPAPPHKGALALSAKDCLIQPTLNSFTTSAAIRRSRVMFAK